MKTSLISSSSEVIRQMIFYINHLCHIFDSLPNSLVISIASTGMIGSEICNSIRQILILWRWALSFDGIEIELIFIRSSTYASFINYTLSYLFFLTGLVFIVILGVLGLFWYDLCWVSKLIEFSGVDIHWLRLRARLCCSRMDLSISSSSLWSPFDLILNLLSLLLIWVSNLDALADLLVMWSVQRMHLLMLILCFRGWVLLCILALVNNWIGYIIWICSILLSIVIAWSVASLSCRSLLTWICHIWQLLRLGCVVLLFIRGSRLILLLHYHLLFYLWFMELLGRSQIDIRDYVCNVGDPIVIRLLWRILLDFLICILSWESSFIMNLASIGLKHLVAPLFRLMWCSLFLSP